jgi:hypothetical protein
MHHRYGHAHHYGAGSLPPSKGFRIFPKTNFFAHDWRNSSIATFGKQDLLDFMGWLRTQPPKLRKDGKPRKPRSSGDPNRTYFNKVNDVVIFLSAHGINRLLKKSEYPKFAEKPVVYYDAEQV